MLWVTTGRLAVLGVLVVVCGVVGHDWASFGGPWGCGSRLDVSWWSVVLWVTTGCLVVVLGVLVVVRGAVRHDWTSGGGPWCCGSRLDISWWTVVLWITTGRLV